jgi:stage V sporulation protein D (sporulation-specific penicillin-binding protein)
MCDKRLWVIFGAVIVLTGVLSWRLFSLQVIQGSSFRAQAQGQQRYFQQVQGERGDIYLTNTNDNSVLVATNQNIYYAYISPRELRGLDEEKKKDFIALYASVLEIEEAEIEEKMQKDSSFEILKKNLCNEELEVVKEIPGLHIQRSVVRNYPEGSLAAHVLGFVGGEKIGQYGVEQYYEDKISGRMGVVEGLRSAWGFLITSDSTQRGENIELTIDYNIQYFVERVLKETVERVGAESGNVLVGDPYTGEILALANYPTVDLNRYSEFPIENLRNPLVQETFEPGSIFKPITMAIALDRGVVSPEETYMDVGEKRIHGRVMRNYDRRSYGLVTMSEILERSINTGIVYVKDQIGNDVFTDYLHKFGFFELTGIDLHGEVFSRNHSFFEGRDVNYATASFGQGIEISAVQLFKGFSVLANGGLLVDPHVLKKDDDYYKLPKERIISPIAANLVTEMMVTTIDQGFGQAAGVDGYHVAGKTGTAQVTYSKLGLPGSGYSEKTIQGFVGYAPAFDPRFVILIKLDYPQTRSAEVSAAPAFSEIAEYILEYKKVPHDHIISTEER